MSESRAQSKKHGIFIRDVNVHPRQFSWEGRQVIPITGQSANAAATMWPGVFRILGNVSLGDEGLIAMQRESDDFRKLDNRNSLWVAEILVHSDSKLALDMARQMYNGKDKRAKLVGAVAFAKHNQLKNLNAIQELMVHRTPYEDDFPDLMDMAVKYLKE